VPLAVMQAAIHESFAAYYIYIYIYIYILQRCDDTQCQCGARKGKSRDGMARVNPLRVITLPGPAVVSCCGGKQHSEQLWTVPHTVTHPDCAICASDQT
jgi:hypothetical protein